MGVVSESGGAVGFPSYEPGRFMQAVEARAEKAEAAKVAYDEMLRQPTMTVTLWFRNIVDGPIRDVMHLPADAIVLVYRDAVTIKTGAETRTIKNVARAEVATVPA